MAEKALEFKQIGNEHYKKREFDAALQNYEKAIEVDPANMTFYSNVAAVLFEQRKFDECIEKCLKAVEVGRKNRADSALIATAFARIGNAYIKKDDLKEALHFIEKSLFERRDPEVVKKQKQLEKDLKERDEKLKEEMFSQMKNLGNVFLKPFGLSTENFQLEPQPGGGYSLRMKK